MLLILSYVIILDNAYVNSASSTINMIIPPSENILVILLI
jgi:hypothetical protein